MDFGDILEQWERQTAAPGRKERGRGAAAPAPRRAPAAPPRGRAPGAAPQNPLEQWLKRNDVPDKDAAAAALPGDAGPRAERRRRLLHKRADAVLDLHNLTQEEAWTDLEAFFRAARQRKLEKVLIIHGKGNHSPGEAVLGVLTRRFIELCPQAGESGYAAPADGGHGATWVLLKDPHRPDRGV